MLTMMHDLLLYLDNVPIAPGSEIKQTKTKKISAFYPFIYSHLKFQPQLLDRNPKTREKERISLSCNVPFGGSQKKIYVTFNCFEHIFEYSLACFGTSLFSLVT